MQRRDRYLPQVTWSLPRRLRLAAPNLSFTPHYPGAWQGVWPGREDTLMACGWPRPGDRSLASPGAKERERRTRRSEHSWSGAGVRRVRLPTLSVRVTGTATLARPAGRGRCQPASRPSASTFTSLLGPVLPGPAGRSVLVPGWDSGAASAKEADNGRDSHRIQRASRTEAGTPARSQALPTARDGSSIQV